MRVGVVGQHLAHRRPCRGHGDRVAEQRAADGDLRLVVVATTGALQHGRRLLGHPVRTQRDARGDRLADRHEVGGEPPPPGEPAGADDLGVRLVVRQQRAGTPGQLAQALVEAVVRHQEADVVGQRRLGDHHGHLAGRERALQGVEVVERYDERPGGDVVRQAGLLRHQAAVLELDQHVVEVAVVLAVEEQHLLAAGRGPGDPDHLGVGARRRQRELPQRKAVAPRQLARDPDRVLGRQQVLRSEADLPAHRLDHGSRAVAGEHGHVGDVEVGVLVAVDVAQA